MGLRSKRQCILLNWFDAGPIILQKAVYIKDDDTIRNIAEESNGRSRIQILPQAIKLFSEGRLKIEVEECHRTKTGA